MHRVKWDNRMKGLAEMRQWVWGRASVLQAEKGLTRPKALKRAQNEWNRREESRPNR